MSNYQFIELYAGLRPDGQPVVERLQVEILDDDSCKLIKSPSFVQGVAKGDNVKLNQDERTFELIKRSGNLSIRVFAKQDIGAIEADVTPRLEKLGGSLDFENERLLVYSIHVSCGFKEIEAILNDHIGEETESAWFYGNVYDPADGVTPLNWWQEILKPQ
ncbi:DUF4265 domain-containing protein [Teredinibacter sp. KSP-S5-2]|uniref:DUF4265 domain-containing protein n=1 Tax=Teredinibacter sp. KSP-S5-2 TaxID=3034506 RepID=UPI002934FD8C|nr:DUF4265 domain-containing protein [Teredinibacter sp. KSP-S5-2]WNO09074.1 DUF4265 domain-containing protein [Teredinibacter sp. KSP-S5-2]